MEWLGQLEIIRDKFSEILFERGEKFRASKLESFMGISKGKMTHWSKGQRATADDLEKIVRKLGFKAEWLLLGAGPMLRGEERGSSEEPSQLHAFIRRQSPYAPLVPIDETEAEGCHRIQIHSMTGAGDAPDVWESESIQEICIPSEFYRPCYEYLRVRGMSMWPEIRPGDVVA